MLHFYSKYKLFDEEMKSACRFSLVMLYVLCLAAVTLSSALKPRRPLATSAGEVALQFSELLRSEYYYKVKEISHVCELPGHNQTTIAIFLTLAKTLCLKKRVREGLEWTRCPEPDKPKYLHCAMTEIHRTGQSNVPVGYICERGAQHQKPTLFQLNNNCSSLGYDSRSSIVQIKLSPESRPWKEHLPIYQPPQCKWNASLGLFTYKKGKEPCKDKRPKNPLGRQGISGRGKFPHLGENAFIVPIIVRDKYGRLQVLAQQSSKAPFNIPLELSKANFNSFRVGANLTNYLYDMGQRMFGSVSRSIKMREEKIYAGPVHDSHNTDNAWLAIYVSVIDDLENKFMTEFPPDSGFFWKSVTREELNYLAASFVDNQEKTSSLNDLCLKMLYEK